MVLTKDHLLPHRRMERRIFYDRVFREITQNGGFQLGIEMLTIPLQARAQVKRDFFQAAIYVGTAVSLLLVIVFLFHNDRHHSFQGIKLYDLIHKNFLSLLRAIHYCTS
jgi:hypothetical protein